MRTRGELWYRPRIRPRHASWIALVAALPSLANVALAASPSRLPPPGQPGSHEAYALDVKSAESDAFHKALAAYDAHLGRAPHDAVAAVERCKLLGATTIDDDNAGGDDEAGLRAELLSHRDEDLAARFPHAKEALLYRLDHKWGDALTTFANQLLVDDRLVWSDRERAHIYNKLARHHAHKKEAALAAHYAQAAMALDPTLDLTLIIGTQLLAEGRRAEAIVSLSARPDGSAYELLQKAQLLADAGAPQRALWLIGLAQERHVFISPAMHAAILERAGRPEEARHKYLELHGQGNRHGALEHAFAIALAGSDATAAAQSYEALRDLGWRGDPLGGYRLALMRKFPSLPWRGRDWLSLLRLLLALIIFALVPGLWVVPIHYWSLWRRLRGPLVIDPALDTRWRLLHVWLAGATFLVVQLLGLDIFAYAEVGSWFSSAAATTATVAAGAAAVAADKPVTSPSALAAFGLWNAAALTVTLALVLVRPRDLRRFGPGAWTVAKCVGRAAAALGILMLVGGLLLIVARDVSHAHGMSSGVLAIDELVRALYQVHGLPAVIVVVVIVAPLTEELVFRSVMLDVLARYMRFGVANVLQALAFASAHGELKRMPYLFVLALLAGSLRRKSGGLLSSILLHASNNALATIVMLAFAAPHVATPAKAPAEVVPSPELVSCARASRELAGVSAAALRGTRGATVEQLNRVAWTLAIDPATSAACLVPAEEAVNGALQLAPETPAILDTKATVYFRQGRFDEAVDLERQAIARINGLVYHSQLARFLRRRSERGGVALLGKGAPPTVGLTWTAAREDQPRAIHVELGRFEDGVELYARLTAAGRPVGLLHAAFGPGHARSYELVPPSGAPALGDDVRFELDLVDARGCEHCKAQQWTWEMQPHDPDVDAYAN